MGYTLAIYINDDGMVGGMPKTLLAMPHAWAFVINYAIFLAEELRPGWRVVVTPDDDDTELCNLESGQPVQPSEYARLVGKE